MSGTVIAVDGISKAYRLGSIGAGSLRQDVMASLRRSRRPSVATSAEGSAERRVGDVFWALRDVNIDIRDGEVIGIIGGNGAGKSTLLKLLSRVTAPTKGEVRIKGRVASLLEVGTGFHPDLSGRENVFLNGAIMGMSKREIRAKFDEIVEFSGVDEFIDTPVKRYSSGMYVRLAFAVAAHLEPDILILDEVLAVGDASFQRKCLGKMEEAARRGRTVLFVSHNMVAVQSLCTRGVLLEHGRVAAQGPIGDVVKQYLEAAQPRNLSEQCWHGDNAPGTELVRLRALRATSSGASDLIGMDSPIRVEIDYERRVADRTFHLELHLINHEEVVVLYTSPGLAPDAPGTYRSSFEVPGDLLNSGGYRFRVMLVEDESRPTWLEGATVAFSVEDLEVRKAGWMTRRPGVLYVPFPWETRAVDGPA